MLTEIYISHVPNVPNVPRWDTPTRQSFYASCAPKKKLICKCPTNIPYGPENWKLVDNYSKLLADLFAWFMARPCFQARIYWLTFSFWIYWFYPFGHAIYCITFGIGFFFWLFHLNMIKWQVKDEKRGYGECGKCGKEYTNIKKNPILWVWFWIRG